MIPLASATADPSFVFIELGVAVLSLALLGRLAGRFGFSSIPLYLLAGLAFGNGGLLPLQFGEGFVRVGAEVGVILLLFMLGLEYTGQELSRSLRTGYPAGLGDLLLNFTPGFATAILLGWDPLAGLLLGGVTYVSSSGVIAKVLADLGRMGNRETRTVVTILVLEDLAMAVYLPVTSVLLAGRDLRSGLVSVVIALLTVAVVLVVAIRYGRRLSRLVTHESDEIVLLSTLGVVLLVAGLAQRLQVSAAVGAFLVGVAVSGPVVERAHKLLAPLRDLFAATFFLFFGLQIDPAKLVPVLPVAAILAVVTALTKIATGWIAAGRRGIDTSGRIRAGTALVARGEFSIVIAGLGVGVAAIDPALQAVSAAYVLLLAVAGPILARVAK
jgi:CPA2 family monovalent cation:H+ antiporter-2